MNTREEDASRSKPGRRRQASLGEEDKQSTKEAATPMAYCAPPYFWLCERPVTIPLLNTKEYVT